jgi:peptidyl-prolyl cis-trans isomerase C
MTGVPQLARPRPLQPDVVVNGETIPAAAIAAEAQYHPAPPGKPGAAWSAAARALAVHALLLQESRRLGLAPEPRAVGAGRRETDDEALIRAVIEASVAPAPPTEADCRETYVRHPHRFRAPTLYAAAHILLPAAPEDAVARAAAATTAAVLLAELVRDSGAFDRLARAHSACSSREAGGRLGQLLAGDTVPEFEAALDRLAPGEIASEPVATRYGLHVVRLDARAEGAVLPYEQVAPRIRESLEKGAWVMAAKRLVATLIAKAEVTGVDLARAA